MKYLILLIISLPITLFGQSKWDNKSSSEVFIENKGQFDLRNWQSNNPVLFGLNQNPFYVFFSEKGITYRLDKVIKNPNRDKSDPYSPKRTNISELTHIKWIGANNNIRVVSSNPVENSFSYAVKDFKTQEVSNKSNLKGFTRLTYQNIYDHIDLEYIIHPEGGIKYSFILHSGANPADIRLEYSFSNTNAAEEFGKAQLVNGDLKISSSLGNIIENKPFTFYNDSKEEITSDYSFVNNILTFDIANYDNSKTVIIDPWVVSPTFATSTAVWEVETDATGNIYTIGGETPMELKKYNAAGVLQWTYVSPWDTSNVWLGTLATDDLGNSYITSGTTPEIERIDNAGVMQWHNNYGGGIGGDAEYWSISFNCDKTKLIIGGMKSVGISDFYAAIFEMDITNGNVLSDQTFAYTNILGGGIGATPEEVRSISAAKNGKFIYLTHNQVGSINQNFTTCPVNVPGFQVNNTHNLGYKCEDYLPETQNGGGLKALVANDNFFYTHSGNQVHQWNLTTGTQITSVALPGGGSSTVPIVGGLVVENSGLAVDDCGNVYAGSKDRVVKFDPSLNILATSMTSFAVYDVSVNNNGEVIAVGAQSNNATVNRNGRIESLAMTACAQYAVICCDASFCQENPVCTTDPAFSLTPNTPGGAWSGPGVNSTTGLFDPAAAGAGTHTITYTLACGNESLDIVVNPCIALTGCEETNGDLTVTNGTGPYTWYEQGNVTTTSNDCVTCGGTLIFGICSVPLPCNITTTGWVASGTGTTYTPTTFPVKVEDANGDTLIINSAGALGPCSTTPTAALTASNVNLCAGDCISFTDNSTNIPSGSLLGWNFPGATPTNSTAASPANICYNTAGSYWATIVYTDPTFNVIDSTGVAITVAACTVPDADFTMSAGPYCAGDCITFTSTSTYAPGATFTWDFGNTQNSAIENPAAPICYATAGTFTVTLTVTDANGTDTETQTVTIVACTTPNASLSASSTNLCVGDCINFADLSTNIPSGSLLGWNFPGATPANSTAANPTNICYNTAGSYWATIVYTDPTFNVIDSTGVAITVAACTVPDADFTMSAGPYCAGDCITFTSTSTYAPGATFAWDFGNTQNSAIENPAAPICYATAGTFTVTLTVTDANGTDTETQTVTVVACTTPNASLSASSTNLCVGDCINFTDLSTNIPPGSLLGWNFPGATPANSTAVNPTNICYNTAGSYWATIVYTDPTFNVIDSTGIAITVTSCIVPDANIDVQTVGPYCTGDCITFGSTSTYQNPATFAWDFGNGSNSNQEVPSGAICYPTAGTYTVSLTVTDAAGSNTETQSILIETCTPPTSLFTLSNTDICENECITFTNSSTNATSYQWTFEGGTPSSSTSSDPGVVCFTTQGSYVISLVTTNVYGTDSTSSIVNVTESPNITAIGDTSIIASQTVPIGVINPDPSLDYLWTPNVGIECTYCSETDVSPLDTMYYYVIATNSAGCSDTDSVLILVEIIQAIGVPSAFSPNDDGFNDVLKVQGFGITNMTFSIFNQYGQKVFEGYDQVSGWDGTYQGKPVNPGVFVYVVEYGIGSETDLILKGNVTVVK